MKKLFSLLVVIALFTTISKAQQASLMPLILGDTIVNTGTVSKAINPTTGYSAIGMQTVITKISGTLGGTAKFQGSLNNSNWEDIGSAFTITDVASQAKAFTQTAGNPYTYYRILFTGAGTMSAQVRVYYVVRKTATQ